MHQNQNSNRRAQWIIVVASMAYALSACGGGGGGASGSPPILGSMTFTTNENVKLAGQLTATDPQGQSVTFAQASAPAHGMLASFTSSGSFAYQPNVNFTGGDSFGVKVTDSGGNVTSGTVSITVHVNQPPTARDEAVRADGAMLNAIDVLSQASDPDGDPLTVTIEKQPLVGTATVNTNGSVSITNLPSGFKGLTPFQYRVTDPSAASATGTIAVFVGADPFRAAFAGDPSGNGSPEVYVTDFANTPGAVTQATQGNMRLQGFVTSSSGATIVYRRADITAPATTDLWFVQSASPGPGTQITLPSGAALVADSNGNDQYQVSPDGQWIAVVAASGGVYTLYLVGASNPTQLNTASPTSTLYVDLPRFSVDSKNIYFLATAAANRANRSLYTVAVSAPAVSAQISAANVAPTDDVLDYFVSPDQTRIVLQANRSATEGFYYVDAKNLGVEIQLNQPLGVGESILGNASSEPPGLIASPLGDEIAYTMQSLGTTSAYLAQVSATPARQTIGPAGAQAIRFRPDESAVLYSTYATTPMIGETGTPDQTVGPGIDAWYDSTGNIVLLKELQVTGLGSSYLSLASTVRGSFGTTQPIGTPGDAAVYFTVGGFDRGVVILAQNAPGAVASEVGLELINALAPGAALPLADFQTPVSLTTDLAQVITY
jgi:hypothetical protein